MDTAPRGLEGCLIQIRDLAGRPRGTGFAADHHGTVITSHEAVDGLPRLVLQAGDRTCLVTAADVTPLPELDLALVCTEGLDAEPLPVGVRDRIETGTYVRIAAGCWREARVLGSGQVTYTATDCFHLLDDAVELAIGTAGRDALRLGGGAAGGPVLDAETGAVVAVLGTALQSGRRDVGFAVPLRHPTPGPLADLLARNAATVPAYGTDLNLAGVLELTATSMGQDGPSGVLAGYAGRAGAGAGAGVVATGPGEPMERSDVVREQDGPPGGFVGHVGRGGAVAPGPVESVGRAGAVPGVTPVGQEGAFAGPVGQPGDIRPVERADVVRQLTEFMAGGGAVLGFVGDPGCGRTTELAALAVRRGRGAEPAPTLWLRGADLAAGDGSVGDAVRRALERAVRIVADFRSLEPGRLGELTPERPARLAAREGRPLLLLLDGPEEMPPGLAHRLPEWTEGTAEWLRETGARLVIACRNEYWESAGAQFPSDVLHPRAAAGTPGSPPTCVHLGDLTPDEAGRARSRFGIPDGALTERDARHPLTLRLLSEVRAVLPDAPSSTGADRHDVFSAHLDLMCLRIAARLAAGNGLRGAAVRRLAARVSGQVHEAARRSLGPGQGELDRESFEAVFPWGPAPDRLGGGSGWASAVLAEGLLVPAGTGYRFAHEELADWIQGLHLDLDEALQALVHRRRTPHGTHPLPVPHHRVGPVVQALLLLARHHGPGQLVQRLEELTHALDPDPGSWWAARLLSRTLLHVPDATPYTGVLRLLADRIVTWRRGQRAVPGEFGPAFWTDLPLPHAERLDLLRHLVLADEAPPETQATGSPGGPESPREPHPPRIPPAVVPRYLDAVARLLAADPAAVQPHLARWFDDERTLPATPYATVATAAQALLHTHRCGALDALTEALVDSAHRRADELLAVLAEDEPSAVCRAVDRWAHDEHPARRVAAVTYGLRAAPHVRTEADRELLRYAALALLARPADTGLHGGALALLVRDPLTRPRHLPQALRHFASGDPYIPPSALVPALATDPDPVLEAFRARLRGPDAGDALRTLADVTTPALARRVAGLVQEAVELRPGTAGHVAEYVDRRLDQGPAARAALLPLVTGLLDGGPEPVRAALATVLPAPGTPGSRPLRRELLEFLLTHEHDPAVLDALLHAAALGLDEDGNGGDDGNGGGDGGGDVQVRDLIHRTGLLLVRTPDGATRFDRGLVDLGRHVPGFAALMARWLTDTPDAWAAVVGPSTRRMLGTLAGVRVPA